VLQLRESDPALESMKRTIEGMAHFLVDALIDVLHMPASRDRLYEMLQKKFPPPESDAVDINDSVVENLYSLATQQQDMTPQELTPEEEVLPEPLVLDPAPRENLFDDEADPYPKTPPQETPQAAAPAEHFSPNPMATTPSPLHEKQREWRGTSAVSAPPEDFTFVLTDDEEPPPPSRATESELLSDATPEQDGLNLDQAHEPLAVHENARRQLDGLIKQVKEEVSVIGNWPGKWATVRQHLQTLRETAMIHGVEEIEMLAFKGWRLLEIRAQRNLALGPAWKKLYTSLAETLHGLAAGIIEPQSMPEVMQLSATLSLLLEHPEKIGELVEPATVNRQAERPEVMVVAPTETASRRFKLPGEDDAELISLINEVRRDRSEQLTAPVAETSQVSEAAVSAGVFAGQRELPDKHVEEKPPHKTPEKHPLLAQFHEETEIYFEICNEALQNIYTNPTSRLGLDSLELGVYSLKVTARKLGIESCARFPEHVEEFVKKAILMRAPLDRLHLQSIREGLEKLRHATRMDELETAAMRQVNNQVLKFLKELHEATPMPQAANHPPSNATLDGFSFRDEKSHAKADSASMSSAPINRPPAHDPLDFLMVDDSNMESP
jgi:hypothetical protein